MKRIVYSTLYFFLMHAWFIHAAALPNLNYQLIQTLPRATDRFTQGLVYDDGFLYEGTGLYGESRLFKTRLNDHTIVAKHRLPTRYFGEGITIIGDKLYQLTYRAETGFIYDKHTLQKIGEFHYNGEGWGLTSHDGILIMSNGSNVLQFIDPQNFSVRKRLSVFANGAPVNQLNDLTYVDGHIFANIWRSMRIAVIDPHSGNVTAWLDLTKLVTAHHNLPDNVLNGLTYDAAQKQLYVAGKRWPVLYIIRSDLLRSVDNL